MGWGCECLAYGIERAYGKKKKDRVGSDFLSVMSVRVKVSPGRVGPGPGKVTRGQLWLIPVASRLKFCTKHGQPTHHACRFYTASSGVCIIR